LPKNVKILPKKVYPNKKKGESEIAGNAGRGYQANSKTKAK
jgi:hypothetical protein